MKMDSPNAKNDELLELSAADLAGPKETVAQPEAAAEPEGEKFVTFCLGEEIFAVRAQQISEVIRPPALTPLPRAPEWLYGIAHVRGQIISVINLSSVCGRTAAPVSAFTRLVVVRPGIFDTAFAFLVDRIGEIVLLKDGESEPSEGGTEPHLLGRARHGSGAIGLLDLEKLLVPLLDQV